MGSVLATFEPIILTLHFIAAFVLVTVILLQAGRGTDIGSMFGAGSSQSLFGARGATTLLTKLTTAMALMFLVTSLSLATIANYTATGAGEESVIGQDEPAATPEATPAPSAPAAGDEASGKNP